MNPVRVGIIGFGTVGRATADIISKHADLIEQRSGVRLAVVAVCRRSSLQPGEIPSGARSVSDWKKLVRADDVDVIVETMGGTDQSLQLVRAALEQGKPVVTANKNLLAEHGDELFALAASRNLPIGFEASVAGGIPILRVIHESTAGDRLRAVHGILNGTANYILTQMEARGIEFGEALEEAQKAGYAEADPTFDIDGLDARDKLSILARMAFGGRLPVSSIPTYGIRQIRAVDIHSAHGLDSTIRLVGSAEQTDSGLEVSVRPWLVSRRSMLAKVEGVNNAVFLVGDNIGTQMFYGRGAGGDATGAAVVSDLIEIARDLAAGQLQAKKVVRLYRCPGTGDLADSPARQLVSAAHRQRSARNRGPRGRGHRARRHQHRLAGAGAAHAQRAPVVRHHRGTGLGARRSSAPSRPSTPSISWWNRCSCCAFSRG